MKQRIFLLAALLAAAVFLCAAAQAEIRVSEFPGMDAIPEQFEILTDGIPPFPEAQIGQDGAITVTGLKAWGIEPEMMTDWNWSYSEGWSAASSESYDDRMVIKAKLEQNEYVHFPALETKDCPAVMSLIISGGYTPDSAPESVSVEFVYDADGIRATCTPYGLRIEKTEKVEEITVSYDLSGQLESVYARLIPPDGFGTLGTFDLVRVTDCLTGELFDELTVAGEADPAAVPFHMADETIPRRVRIQERDPFACDDGDPALPVLDPLPADTLPEVWPAEYPDAFPAFSCEVVDGKYIWTLESLTGWGARVNIPGETYALTGGSYINYFMRSYTMDAVPADQFRIVPEGQDGYFCGSVETEPGPYWMDLEGQVCTDSEGNLTPTLRLGLTIQEGRDIRVEYFSDGTTLKKKIGMEINGEIVTGDYGEDNRLQ